MNNIIQSISTRMVPVIQMAEKGSGLQRGRINRNRWNPGKRSGENLLKTKTSSHSPGRWLLGVDEVFSLLIGSRVCQAG